MIDGFGTYLRIKVCDLTEWCISRYVKIGVSISWSLPLFNLSLLNIFTPRGMVKCYKRSLNKYCQYLFYNSKIKLELSHTPSRGMFQKTNQK